MMRTFQDRAAFDEAAAVIMAETIRAAIADRGAALVALAGGSTPFPAYRVLAALPEIDWAKVTVLPTDERCVAMDDPLHNGAQLVEIFGPVGAHIEQLYPYESRNLTEGKSLLSQGQIDLAVLGMGLDGHTASLFPGPDLEAGFASEAPIIAIRPDPLPPEAPVSRLSLSAAALAEARHVMLLMTGTEKRAVLDAALAEQPPVAPIARLAARVPMTLFWAP